MEELVNSFGAIFNLLWSSKLMGMPILFWFVIIGVFGVLVLLFKARKEIKFEK